MKLSLGICAYNEEKNIGRLLSLLKEQRSLFEIIVVASGCTDNTINIVKENIKKDRRIKLLIEKQRKGKASAVNLILKHAKGEIIILEGADTLPKKDTIEKLTAPFREKTIGMTGARPIPLNNKSSFTGSTAHLIWGLHHILAAKKPKLGEMVAFRNIISQIPSDTAVDEVAIEHLILKKGLKLKYASDALVFNKGPSTIKDLIRQRKRIYLGHMDMKKRFAYNPSTEYIPSVLNALIKVKKTKWTLFSIILDTYIRAIAFVTYIFTKKAPYNWNISQTTKSLR